MRRAGRSNGRRYRAVPGVAAVLLLVTMVPPASGGTVRCAGLTATLVGTDGDDVLVGTTADDVIHALGGDDVVDGRGGADVICGGAGDDTLDGGFGDDRLLGGGGDDTLVGGAGHDHLAGGGGRDILRGGVGDDRLLGGRGADVIVGGPGDDRITAGEGHDVVRGGDGRDRVRGDRGNDVIEGGEGADRLDGGAGADLVDGGPGGDRVRGGANADRVLGGDGDDTLDGGDGPDTCDGGDGEDAASACEILVSTERGQLSPPRIRPSPGAVALTFDDGPHPVFTPPILDVLDRYGVRATFFVLGWQAERYPDLLADIAARGHSVQNHTYLHKRLTSWSSATVAWELQRTQDIVEEITGTFPRCYRPPYGVTDARVRAVAGGLGLTEVIWDYGSNDWARPPVATIVSLSLRAGGGDVVLLHDAGGIRWNTVAALPGIIEGFRDRDLEFETLCD